MALDPVTSISDTIGKALDAAKEWMSQYADPEKRRLREIAKLNDQIDKKAARIEQLGGTLRERYPKP